MSEVEQGDGAATVAARETRFRVINGDRIAVCWGSSTELLAWADVISVQSLRNCSIITACGRTIKVRSPLRAVVAELAPLGLMQVRRDTAVNITRVRRIVGAGRHRLLIILDDDRRVEVGREFQRQVRARFASA